MVLSFLKANLVSYNVTTYMYYMYVNYYSGWVYSRANESSKVASLRTFRCPLC